MESVTIYLVCVPRVGTEDCIYGRFYWKHVADEMASTYRCLFGEQAYVRKMEVTYKPEWLSQERRDFLMQLKAEQAQ